MYFVKLPQLILLCFASAVVCAQAQTLYKYQDANGVWVYTDRQPDGEQDYEQAALEASLEKAEVRLYQRSNEAGWLLIAENTYFGPVQVAYELAQMNNLAADTARRGMLVLPPRSETELLAVARGDLSQPSGFEYQFQYIPGDPEADHQPQRPYRLPFASASNFPVSQAFPDGITHADPSSEYALDFVMPIGSGVYAARGGIVIEVASDFFRSGTDMNTDGPRANVVRVLHDDGTMSLYAHLNWNSIRVVPGRRVQRGEYLADSGNTGFSTGPHLHFAVQRNVGGAIVSVPIQFEGPNGSATVLRTGDEPTAYWYALVPANTVSKVISGGQTGADQGGLAAALDRGTPCGGWCPAGRTSEAGRIPAIYPVQELPGAGYTERTLANVRDSDGTVIIFAGVLEGGAGLTRTYCDQESKPCVLIDASTMSHEEAVGALMVFLADNDIGVLNVAGPRASKWPGAHAYTYTLITAMLARLSSS